MSEIKLTGRNSKEENKKVEQEILENGETRRSLRESLKKKIGLDIEDKKEFPVLDRKFSWKKVESKLHEADASSSFPQVLRAGVQLIADNAYQTVETTYEDWAHTVASSKDTELYAPLHGIQFPKEVGRQETFPESSAAGLSIALQNKKYGQIFSVEKELMEDDQTGQFQKQVSLIGEYLKLVMEVLCYGKLASASNMEYAGMRVAASETAPSYESTYPWSTSLRGGGATRPSSFGALSQANIQSAQIALMNQKNLLGLKMMVNPNRIIISPYYHFDLSVLLNSAYYPSGAAAAGSTGGAFSINPMKGIASPTISRFVFKNDGTVDGNSKAWYLLDDSKPFFVAQIREAIKVEQEAPNAGESFNRDIIRFKGETRCNADFIDPRFAYQGNDGSV